MIPERFCQFFGLNGGWRLNIRLAEVFFSEAVGLLGLAGEVVFDQLEDFLFGGEVPESIRGQNQITEAGVHRDHFKLGGILDVGTFERGFGSLGDSVEVLLLLQVVVPQCTCRLQNPLYVNFVVCL